MIIAAGINMPFVGFVAPLTWVTVPLAVLSALAVTAERIAGAVRVEEVLKDLPRSRPG